MANIQRMMRPAKANRVLLAGLPMLIALQTAWTTLMPMLKMSLGETAGDRTAHVGLAMMGEQGRTTIRILDQRDQNVPRGIVGAHPIVLERGQGSLVWDVEGRDDLDFFGGVGVLDLGHNHPRVVQAVRAQLERLTHASFQVAGYPPYIELAARHDPRRARTGLHAGGGVGGRRRCGVHRNVIRVLAPQVTTDEQLARGLHIARQALTAAGHRPVLSRQEAS